MPPRDYVAGGEAFSRALLHGGWKRGPRSRSGQRFALPPSAEIARDWRLRALPFCKRVEEGSTIPLRPALRSTAFGGRLSSAGPWTPLHIGLFGGQWTLSGLWGRGGRNIPTIRPRPAQLGRSGCPFPPTRKSPLSVRAPVSGSIGQSGRPETMAHQRSGRRESRAKRWARAQSIER